MATLLKLDSSPMGERSVSRKLTGRFAETWLRAHPDGRIVERDLTTLNLGVIDGLWVGAAYTPEASRTEEQTAALRASDKLIAELQGAEEYVFGVPMHNFGIPSTLKLWIDQISRVGKTFSLRSGRTQGAADREKSDPPAGHRRRVRPGHGHGGTRFCHPLSASGVGVPGDHRRYRHRRGRHRATKHGESRPANFSGAFA